MDATATAPMDTTPVSHDVAASLEAAEGRAWTDMYAAAPTDFAQSAGLDVREVAGAVILRWAATGRRYFSRAIGLGVVQPATPEALDEILDWYAAAGITMFLLQSQPHCRPTGYEQRLRERGLEPFDAQDRMVRGNQPLARSAAAPATGRELVVERVGPDTVEEWSAFLQRVYRLDTGRWLHALHDRPGWHQYTVRERGEIVAARGVFIGPDGTAWLGMDGPVPGITTDDYEPDAAVCATIVADGLAGGVRRFIADIEAPSANMDTPAYDYFARLGFGRPYVRRHWTRA